MEFPRVIPNSDGAGIIDQIGDGVTQLSAGQRVWLFNGQRNGRAFGTAAEYITLADYLVTPLPDDLSFAAGATLGIPCMTAWCSLFGDARITGQTVLVTGGAGAVGHYAVQLAKWGGARVIATVSSPTKDMEARLAGADLVVNYRTEDVVAKVMAFSETRGIDRVVDVDFGGNLATTLKIMAMNSTIAIYATNGQSHACHSDARLDGKMHRPAHPGVVCAAARTFGRSPGRFFEMAGERPAHPQYRRTIRARGHRPGAPCGRKRRQARHRHCRLRPVAWSMGAGNSSPSPRSCRERVGVRGSCSEF
jgi:hypothetical protein